MFDTHVHTKISTDSKMELEDAIKLAKDKDISLIITEHMDLKFPKEGLFCFDAEDYFNQYAKYRNDRLLLGIEIGMKDDCVYESKELIENYPFDYVLGSIHLVNNLDIYYPKYYEGVSKKEAYKSYFNAMLKAVNEFDFIDSMGHIDYIARYSKFEDREIYYEEFSEIIDKILKTIIEKEKCMELNTRRLDDIKVAKNLIPIYKRFRELGGREITLGSDAHNSLAIGGNFSVAKEIVDFCDLRVVYFKDRKKQYDKI
ncbi:histidinol phosphate phosphatase [Clostridium sp. CX1]|uniref:Histidinol-phosphatase n=1 Tax=Clostridium tanneri TaxID=3037988 RepID=A0ABU4JSP6_9CLOT|nr:MULTISPECIES: histidinol phosphate phosphatase [unclassified Clostridium]MCT8976946.1 histidinol phosphate phosphatase [Clostridium sp. CX1]MDW8801154.1 histidinol phosphate phosphatase [Clostridium sp. A1-XYC3]